MRLMRCAFNIPFTKEWGGQYCQIKFVLVLLSHEQNTMIKRDQLGLQNKPQIERSLSTIQSTHMTMMRLMTTLDSNLSSIN